MTRILDLSDDTRVISRLHLCGIKRDTGKRPLEVKVNEFICVETNNYDRNIKY